ncbi:hypothetical protein CK203_061202 [Vitis vinifera]|uniref:Uncharacterized protein n=1 Tax=Vitis vinifera TaxID=29760 RepID=A0A438GFX4_VITVI|nr:hypothetical protein CK203_061202 [Vitis vinifera]
MSTSVVLELHRNPTKWVKVVEDIVQLKNKISPNHESLVGSFDEELRKNNFGVLYTQQADGHTQQADGEFVGYFMYSWPSSLLL